MNELLKIVPPSKNFLEKFYVAIDIKKPKYSFKHNKQPIIMDMWEIVVSTVFGYLFGRVMGFLLKK